MSRYEDKDMDPKEIAKLMYEHYMLWSNCAGIPDCDLWDEQNILYQLELFMKHFFNNINEMNELGFSWIPQNLVLYLHFYNDDEYFISIEAIVDDISCDDNGKYDADVLFVLNTNDDSLPPLDKFVEGENEENKEETHEEWVNRLINGDDEEDDDEENDREDWQK